MNSLHFLYFIFDYGRMINLIAVSCLCSYHNVLPDSFFGFHMFKIRLEKGMEILNILLNVIR